MSSRFLVLLFVVRWLLGAGSVALWAEDWPTYQHDNRRSAVTSEQLNLPLTRVWEYSSANYPKTAWAGPAKWDSYANIRKLKSMRNFDPVFFVTAVDGQLFFGSSTDDAVHCLDAATGRENWVFFTDGPVRLPPSFHESRLYFGSDDGFVYCLGAESGDLVWRHQVAPGERRIPVNGKMTSLHPCRSGVLVQDSKAYFAASLLPWKKTYLCALDAASGATAGPGLYRKEYGEMTAQGPMLASSNNLYVSQGRQVPLVFERDSGELLQSLGRSGFGGVFGLLTEDSIFVHGFGQNHRAEGELRFFDGRKDLLVTFPHATSIVIYAGLLYVHADGLLQAFDRNAYLGIQDQIRRCQQSLEQAQNQKKKLGADADTSERQQLDAAIAAAQAKIRKLQAELPSVFLWRVPCDCPLTLILAGETLFAGGEDKVAAYALGSGRQLWSAPVAGRAYGLAAAQGRLFVSTDRGKIVCFASTSR